MMTQERLKEICTDTVRAFGRQEWFRDVTVYNAHPRTGEPTLEIKCNYTPLLERKRIFEFVERYNLVLRFLEVDPAGNPKE